MLRLVRSVSLARLGAHRQFIGLRQPGFRAYLMRLEGMSHDARVLGTSNARTAFANDLTLVLRGRWVDFREGERPVPEGHAACGPASATLTDRWEPGLLLVTLEWDTPRLTGYRVARLSALTQAAAQHFVDVLSNEAHRGDDFTALEALLERLRSDGFPVPKVTRREPPEAAVRAAQMLNQALAHLDQAPMWVDFTSQRSERQWRRDLKESNEWLGLLGGTFRHTLNTVRLQFAASLLTAPGVRVAEVAERLGYGDERSLMQAMRRAKMSLELIRGAR